MFSGFIVLFDASVLYPAPVRDLLIELAIEDMYSAKWSERIHKEWMENLLRKRPDLKREKLERTKKQLNESVEDCLVEDFENLIAGIKLPDQHDRHVLAADIKGQAQIIVTYNLKDFPDHALAEFGIEAQHPDDFFMNQSELDIATFLTVAKRIRKSLRNPPKSPEEYTVTLKKHALVKTSELLAKFGGVI